MVKKLRLLITVFMIAWGLLGNNFAGAVIPGSGSGGSIDVSYNSSTGSSFLGYAGSYGASAPSLLPSFATSLSSLSLGLNLNSFNGSLTSSLLSSNGSSFPFSSAPTSLNSIFSFNPASFFGLTASATLDSLYLGSIPSALSVGGLGGYSINSSLSSLASGSVFPSVMSIGSSLFPSLIGGASPSIGFLFNSYSNLLISIYLPVYYSIFSPLFLSGTTSNSLTNSSLPSGSAVLSSSPSLATTSAASTSLTAGGTSVGLLSSLAGGGTSLVAAGAVAGTAITAIGGGIAAFVAATQLPADAPLLPNILPKLNIADSAKLTPAR